MPAMRTPNISSAALRVTDRVSPLVDWSNWLFIISFSFMMCFCSDYGCEMAGLKLPRIDAGQELFEKIVRLRGVHTVLQIQGFVSARCDCHQVGGAC